MLSEASKLGLVLRHIIRSAKMLSYYKKYIYQIKLLSPKKVLSCLHLHIHGSVLKSFKGVIAQFTDVISIQVPFKTM